jgi:hypothetical protein
MSDPIVYWHHAGRPKNKEDCRVLTVVTIYDKDNEHEDHCVTLNCRREDLDKLIWQLENARRERDKVVVK